MSDQQPDAERQAQLRQHLKEMFDYARTGDAATLARLLDLGVPVNLRNEIESLVNAGQLSDEEIIARIESRLNGDESLLLLPKSTVAPVPSMPTTRPKPWVSWQTRSPTANCSITGSGRAANGLLA